MIDLGSPRIPTWLVHNSLPVCHEDGSQEMNEWVSSSTGFFFFLFVMIDETGWLEIRGVGGPNNAQQSPSIIVTWEREAEKPPCILISGSEVTYVVARGRGGAENTDSGTCCMGVHQPRNDSFAHGFFSCISSLSVIIFLCSSGSFYSYLLFHAVFFVYTHVDPMLPALKITHSTLIILSRPPTGIGRFS